MTMITLMFAVCFISNSYADRSRFGIWDDKMHVVYHVSESAKVNFVLNNIRNHLKGEGGPDKVDIVLVVHGPALESFDSLNAPDKVVSQVKAIQKQGVELIACTNSLQVSSLVTSDLVGTFKVAEEGGVTRIARLQSQGYLYVRP